MASQSYPSNSSNLQINNNDFVLIDNQSFNFTGADQSYTIPANSNLLHIKMWGAGGGEGTNSSGGAGGYTESYIEIPNTSNSLSLIVGEGGSGGTNINDTYGGGGGSGDDGNSAGGQGGGRSAIAFDGNYILVAGGGGGGGYSTSDKNGGQGGGLVGGNAYSTNTGGLGASQNSVGFGGNGSTRNGEDGGVGNQWQGGRGSISGSGWGGGGGGGGYFGGGGGGGSTADHGGGGGGSGFAGRDVQSFLIGTDYGSAASYLDANGRMDDITGVKYFNTKVLGGDNNTGYPLVQNANYGKGGNSSNGGNGFIEIIAYRTDLNDYTYSWQPNSETTSSITVQPTATTTYTVDVTSVTTTCQSDVTISVNQRDFVTIDSTVCDSIFWAGNSLTNSGTYYDSLQNIAGCDSIVTLNLTINTSPTIYLGIDTILCANATIDLDAGSGFTYLWQDGTTSQTLTASITGAYDVTITDINGCSDSDTINVTLATPLVVTLDSTKVTCNGLTDGTATATVTGGTPNYSYLWDDANSQTTATATNLSAGTFTVSVTDDNNCSASNSISIVEPTILTAIAQGPPQFADFDLHRRIQ